MKSMGRLEGPNLYVVKLSKEISVCVECHGATSVRGPEFENHVTTSKH